MNKHAWRFAVVAAGFVASAPAVAGALRWAYTGRSSRSRRPAGPDRANVMPTVFHELELTRLSEQVRHAREGLDSGRITRVRAGTAAYDGALLDACHALGLPLPTHLPPLTDGERLDLETRLVGAGLHW